MSHPPVGLPPTCPRPPQSLLWVHDAVAQHQFEPQLPPLPENILEESDDSVKIVSLVKNAEPLVSGHESGGVMSSYTKYLGNVLWGDQLFLRLELNLA